MEKSNVELGDFIRNFGRQFDNLEGENLSSNTRFRELAEWTSLQALVIIVSLDSDYGVTISASQLEEMQTIEDLFKLVTSKLQD